MEPTTTTILAQLVGAIVTAIFFAITWLREGRARAWAEEDRRRIARELDERLAREARERIEVARKVEEKLNSSIEVTRAAHRAIAAQVDENTLLSKEAFKEANGHNTKIAQVVQMAAAVPELAARAAVAAMTATQRISVDPAKIEVVNSERHPVHVVQD